MREEEKIFCEKCGQRLKKSKIPFMKGMEFHEFKEGFYCGPCSKKKVEESRK